MQNHKKDCSNNKPCVCSSKSCPRNGVYCECIAHHIAQGNKPACMKDIK